MQTLIWQSLIIGFLIQRSSERFLDDNCQNSMGMRITNGNNAEREAAAWMAAIRNEVEFICGGTVIHKRFVLTAAHCIKDQGNLFVKLGAYNLSRPLVEYSVSNSVIHREYSHGTQLHDIGLLQLALDIVFTGQIIPICIDLNPMAEREVENAYTFDAYGWGRTRTGNISEILQRVTLDHYDRRRCNRKAYAPLTINQICAGSSNKDTCQGDSGGPLIQNVNYNGTRHLTQLGIVSYGSRSCAGLGIYTNVASYADWIIEKIEALYPEYSEQPPLTDMASPVSIRPPPESAVFGAENFGTARLLFEPCGTSLSSRIANGENAEPEAAAWMAGIYTTYLLCGGTVIHRHFVLTSAQCLRAGQEQNLTVKLGAYDNRRPTLVYSVSKKIIHNEFDSIRFIHDVGLLQLSRNIQFSWHVYPICIILNPEVKSKVESAYTFDAYGWGKTNNSQINHILKKVTLDRFDRRDPSVGDGGGPLTKRVIINGLQRQTQLGIISAGTGDGIGIYTDVTSYVDWILQEVGVLRTTI